MATSNSFLFPQHVPISLKRLKSPTWVQASCKHTDFFSSIPNPYHPTEDPTTSPPTFTPNLEQPAYLPEARVKSVVYRSVSYQPRLSTCLLRYTNTEFYFSLSRQSIHEGLVRSRGKIFVTRHRRLHGINIRLASASDTDIKTVLPTMPEHVWSCL